MRDPAAQQLSCGHWVELWFLPQQIPGVVVDSLAAATVADMSFGVAAMTGIEFLRTRPTMTEKPPRRFTKQALFRTAESDIFNSKPCLVEVRALLGDLQGHG